MYLSWLPAKGRQLVSNQSFIIANNIQSIFDNQGKNQKKVTELTGVGRSTISNIWNGEVPTLENLIRIWLALVNHQ
ncbi:helix-turn-helix transcriptional regulator (plasmid) [Arthrobacter citreus]|nr:helix-turn-helix transcriptional regulator [Arthrobacter citreus]